MINYQLWPLQNLYNLLHYLLIRLEEPMTCDGGPACRQMLAL